MIDRISLFNLLVVYRCKAILTRDPQILSPSALPSPRASCMANPQSPHMISSRNSYLRHYLRCILTKQVTRKPELTDAQKQPLFRFVHLNPRRSPGVPCAASIHPSLLKLNLPPGGAGATISQNTEALTRHVSYIFLSSKVS